MKTYYDLTVSEKKKYEKEFKKTPGGKALWIETIIINLLVIAVFIATLMVDIKAGTAFSTYVIFIVLGIGEICKLYFNINFTSWLKNKHNIKRW